MALSKWRPAEEECNLLFAYGALMRGMERGSFIGNPDKSRYLGTGAVSGVLYEAGSFSGLIESFNGSMVEGELYELFDFETFFATLDLIEGCWPDQPERGLYVRKIIAVHTQDGVQRAWVYMLNQPVAGFIENNSGNLRRTEFATALPAE